MLEFDGLEIRQDDFALTAHVSIPRGAHLAIIGPSGAGKSTFLAALSGFVDPAAGRIVWDGTRIDGLAPAERPVATLFQDNNLFPHLTAARNVGLGLRPNGRMSARDRAEVEAILSAVGLPGMGDRKPGQLSGGQQSRVALARAVLQDRPILALDEPFAALGPALKAEMIDLLHGIATRRGLTVLMVTHEPADALRLGGQTLVVAGGAVTGPFETGPLLADPPAGLRDYLG